MSSYFVLDVYTAKLIMQTAKAASSHVHYLQFIKDATFLGEISQGRTIYGGVIHYKIMRHIELLFFFLLQIKLSNYPNCSWTERPEQ